MSDSNPETATSEAESSLPDHGDLVAAPAVPSDEPEITDGGTGSDSSVVSEMDKLSLEQALIDFSVANSRVLDLTQRVVALTEEVRRLHDENARLRIDASRMRELEQSTAYQAVRAARASGRLGRKAISRLRGR